VKAHGHAVRRKKRRMHLKAKQIRLVQAASIEIDVGPIILQQLHDSLFAASIKH